MKAYIPIYLMSLIAFGVSAQESAQPLILPAYYAQRVSPDGKYVMAQDLSGNAILYNIETSEEFWYGGFYPGNGNCVTNTGVIVGQDIENSRAAIMSNGTGATPQVLYVNLQSSFDAVTPDYTRVCGWIQNQRSGLFQIPFYCDIDASGKVGAPQALPYPEKDFFGDTPQFCTASHISDDGKTIAGIVQDGSGFYSYPIVYKQAESGEWSYVCPSEPLFNPDHLEIPKFPDLDDKNLNEAIDKYWMEMAKVGKYARFIPNMALSPSGDILLASLGITDDEYSTDQSYGYREYAFNISDNTLEVVNTDYENLIPVQILPNGTMVSTAAPETNNEYNSYILMNDTETISFEEYLARTNPEYLPWFEEYLNIFNTGIVSGTLSFSNDMSVIVGGVPIDDMMSYIITAANAGVESIAVTEAEVYKVYNLSGIKVLDTKDNSDLNSLASGIYIINGKKIKL